MIPEEMMSDSMVLNAMVKFAMASKSEIDIAFESAVHVTFEPPTHPPFLPFPAQPT